jgi:hypothetical protein
MILTNACCCCFSFSFLFNKNAKASDCRAQNDRSAKTGSGQT